MSAVRGGWKAGVVGLTVLLSVLVWILVFSEDGRDRGNGETASTGAAANAASEEADGIPGPTPDVVEVEIAASRELHLSGGVAVSVHDIRGGLIEGVIMSLRAWDTAEEVQDSGPVHQGSYSDGPHRLGPDSGGRFVFTGVPVGGPWSIEVSADGYVRHRECVAEVRAGQVVEVAVVLLSGGRVSGCVANVDGQPVAGATVTVGGATPAVSGLDGTFQVTGARTGITVVQAAKAGWAMGLPRPTVEVRSEEEVRDVEIVMYPDRPIRGSVVDVARRPVRGVEVLCQYEGDGQADYAVETETDVSGQFTLSPIPDMGTYRVRAKADGHRPAERGRVAPGAQIEIVLDPAGRIDVVPVARDTGAAIVPSKLVLELVASLAGGDFPGDAEWYLPNQEGIQVGPNRYSVPYEGSGRYCVRVEAGGFAPGRTPVSELNGSENVGPFVVTLERAGDISGIVVHASTQAPVAGAAVSLLVPGCKGRLGGKKVLGVLVRDDYVRRGWTETGPDGAFSFDGLEEGTYLLRVEGKNLPVVIVDGIDVVAGVRRSPLLVEIPEGGALIGSITAKDGTPAAGVGVVAHRSDGVFGSAVSDEDGSYRIRAVAAGFYKVELGDANRSRSVRRSVGLYGRSAESLEPDPGEYAVQVRDDQTTRVDFDLRFAEGAVVGTILVNGMPAGGLEVRLRRIRKTASGERGDMLGDMMLPRARSQSNGSYRLDGVPPGTYDLKLFDSGFTNVLVQQRIEIAGGAELVVDIRYDAARVRGIVVDAEGAVPIEGAAVRASRTGSDGVVVEHDAVTGRNGDFDFDLLSAGDYTIQAQTRWGASCAKGFSLAAGEDLSVQLTMEVGSAIRVRLLPAGWALDGLVVELVDDSTDQRQLVAEKHVNANGKLVFSGIRPGTYELRVRQGNPARFATAKVTVMKGEEAEVTMTLTADKR